MTYLLSQPFLAVVLFIAALIFVHEMGHFLVGKICGMGVEVFSVGVGPRLLSFKIGETEFRVGLFPFGGYAKFAGMSRSEPVLDHFRGREFYRAPVLARAATLLAGPFANLLFAAFIYAVHGYVGIEQAPSRLGEILRGSPAEKAGLMTGDLVTSINGQKISYWDEFRTLVAQAPGKELTLNIDRNGEQRSVTLIPESQKSEEGPGDQGKIGVSLGINPAVLTVKEASIAAQAGLHTGDKLKLIATAGASFELRSWNDALRAFEEQYRAGARELRLRVTRPIVNAVPGGEAAEKINSEEHEFVLAPATAWSGLAKNLTTHELQQQLVASLGLSDSQLTVARVHGNLALQPGDRLLRFEGVEIDDFPGLARFLQANRQETVKLLLERKGQQITEDLALEPVDVQRPEGKETYYRLNAEFLGAPELPDLILEKHTGMWAAASFGFREMLEKAGFVAHGLWQLLTGQLPLKALGGPILIAKFAGEAVEHGALAFFSTMAIISINLGILNLFPIPALDGGQLLMALFEGVRRRPLSEVAVENYQRVGFVMVVALMVLATYNDLSRFWAAMLRGIQG